MGKPGVSRPKRHHYVPRLCLQHFRGDSPKNMIWTFDIETAKWRPSRIEETGAQTNFYSIPRSDGTFDDTIEHMLAEIESAAAAPYEQLLAGEIPTGQARADFALFVASLYCRTPAIINAYAEIDGKFAQQLLNWNTETRAQFDALIDRMEADTGELAGDRDELWEFHQDKDRYAIGVPRQRGFTVLKVADELTRLFHDRTWTVVQAGAGEFITSDHPVYRFVPFREQHALHGDGGFGNPEAEVTVPLSRQTMLLISGRPQAPRLFTAPSWTVAQLNRMRCIYAERFVYASKRHEETAAMALEHKDTRFRMEISNREYAEVIVQR